LLTVTVNISATFYTTLVVVAVLTSQLAGAWLDFVLRKEWPLLTPSAGTAEFEITPGNSPVASALTPE
jgi:hypothetical protein